MFNWDIYQPLHNTVIHHSFWPLLSPRQVLRPGRSGTARAQPRVPAAQSGGLAVSSAAGLFATLGILPSWGRALGILNILTEHFVDVLFSFIKTALVVLEYIFSPNSVATLRGSYGEG